MSETIPTESQPSTIPFRLHPRVFTALGSELVTNDIVAIIELVKNSYDALATRVDVRIRTIDDTELLCIEVEDNGIGMPLGIIKNVWSVVATPHKQDIPLSQSGGRTRRVSGEKGLGRLSAARLGKKLELVTKSAREPCWHVTVMWAQLAQATTLDACNITVRPCPLPMARQEAGTLVRVLDLNTTWDSERIQELRDQLSRLVSPFATKSDFEIWLTFPGKDKPENAEIKPRAFLASPPYLLKGSVDDLGYLRAEYCYSSSQRTRTANFSELIWQPNHLDSGSIAEDKTDLNPLCGPFEFEIRAWDIDPESIAQISQRFEANKSTIRGDIRNYRGISVYRDKILVLPKSDSARDWLGLDLRRVSKVGTRLSTSQIVGYVAISAEHNADIRDTSDRERLEDNDAVADFKKLLKIIVSVLESERMQDRQEATKSEPPFQDLFADLSPDVLVENVQQAVNRGAPIGIVLPMVEEYSAKVHETVNRIEQRLVYYSRLASIGVLAALIVHEVRNHTFTIGGLVRSVRKMVELGDPAALKLERDLKFAEQGIRSLERVAERFAPLASRTVRTRRRDSVLEEIIRECVAMRETEIQAKKVRIEIDSASETTVAVDPGELVAVFINLFDNALYWMSTVKDRPRHIRFCVTPQPSTSRVYVQIDDSGSGIRPGDEERIFWPGVTRKLEGIGMGLTVASEIVAQYQGKMRLVTPGGLGGASFGFDLPLTTRGQ